VRPRPDRDKEFVLHDVPGSSNGAARFYKYRLGPISFRCKILIAGVTVEVRPPTTWSARRVGAVFEFAV
jgi:hypothetical protein